MKNFELDEFRLRLLRLILQEFPEIKSINIVDDVEETM